MRKYAILKNNVITQTIDLETNQIDDLSKSSEMIIDIHDMVPQPSVGWILNGNTIEIPQNNSDREKFEIELNDRKVEAGIKLARLAINRIGARNKILNKSGSQVTALLNQLVGIKMLMETGALGTARAGCVQLKYIYTEYSDILDIVITEINNFENNFGL